MSLSEKLEAARVALGKRKEREFQEQPYPPAPAKDGLLKPAPARAHGGNKLLAGHLAHEFLSLGTLLGRRIEPSRAGPVLASTPAARAEPQPTRSYAEVSWLLMTSGAHIPGIVNPTQLGR